MQDTGIEAYIITYLLCAAGVLASILLPLLYALLPKMKLGEATYGTYSLAGLRPLVAPILITAVVSLIISLLTALIVLGASGGSLSSPFAAILAGYASDSTLQRLKDTPEATAVPEVSPEES